MNPIEQHDSTWHDGLQDLLDGDLQPAERSAVEAHVASCARCRAQYARLKRLDAKLTLKLATISLDASFDRQVLARIEALDARARERARRAADLELRDNLETIARGWRRGLALLIGGTIAGIALAFAVMTWADAAGITEKMLGATLRIDAPNTDLIGILLISGVCAMIGGGISRWLAATLS